MACGKNRSEAEIDCPKGSPKGQPQADQKRTDDRPAEDGALNSGRLIPPPVEEIYLQRANDFQPKEGVATGGQESDPPIVVRDGSADHTAKGRAGMQRGQSTHASRGTNIPDSGVSSTLAALGTKAGKEPKHRFRSLARLLDRQMLGEAFRMLKRRAAPGIDGVTYGEYAENLDENLLQLVTRLKQGTYRARPVKRQWIAKPGSDKLRPLGIPVLEDKIVQQAVRMILEPIWENDFVQDLWIGKVIAKESKGRVLFRRYADDSIVAFERKDDAEAYLRRLPERLAKFGLELATEKSALVKFNRWESESSGKFTFLGFDFYWAASRRNPKGRNVKRRTNARKFRASLAALKEWLRKARSLPLRDIIATLKRKLQGYWNYYCVIGNSERTSAYSYEVVQLVYKWLNRRSQRKSFTAESFKAAWTRWQMPKPRVNEKPLPKSARQNQPCRA